MALLELTDRIRAALDDNDFAISVLLNLSKAFDTVDYSVQLLKLLIYGFHSNAQKWLSNYVHNRNLYFLGYESKRNTVQYGVPQGSILEPLLFLIYIYDLSAVSITTMPCLFADDTNIFISNRNLTLSPET